ncbi:MAG: ParB/RepB/Spo0J family partition protein [Gammaproteobacteria bacterium]|nr:ParB/RepB/Spo0J family partition protein [Gammaproteobacteria bacterium]
MKRRGLGRGLDALLGDAKAEIAAEIAPISAEKDAERLRRLPIEQIQRGVYQPRVHFDPDALADLASSIKAQGILQPIVVRPVGAGYELIAGERRWRAAQLAGLHEIPAIVRDLPEAAVAAVALIENIQREDLNALEEANAFQRLIAEFELTHQEVADAVGRSRAAVSNLLRLLELAPEIKTFIDEGKLDMGHGRALLALSMPDQLRVAKEAVAKQLSVREVERMVKQGTLIKTAKTAPKQDPNIARLERDLADKLGASVEIQYAGKGKGKLVIAFRSNDELDGILKHIR